MCIIDDRGVLLHSMPASSLFGLCGAKIMFPSNSLLNLGYAELS